MCASTIIFLAHPYKVAVALLSFSSERFWFRMASDCLFETMSCQYRRAVTSSGLQPCCNGSALCVQTHHDTAGAVRVSNHICIRLD